MTKKHKVDMELRAHLSVIEDRLAQIVRNGNAELGFLSKTADELNRIAAQLKTIDDRLSQIFVNTWHSAKRKRR